MPYVRCRNCGLAAYTASGYSSRDRCPRCANPLPPTAAPSTTDRWRDSTLAALGRAAREPLSSNEHDSAPRRAHPIHRALTLAREQLEMEVALLSEVRDEEEVILHSDGDVSWLGMTEAMRMPLTDTYCQRLLEGRIKDVITDAQRDERVFDLAVTTEAGIGAYIGVPLKTEDIRLYVLCCIAREARPTLGDADVRFLRGLGETVVAELSSQT